MFGRIFVALAALSIGAACSTTVNGSPTSSGGSSSGAAASTEQVGSCKESCNKMKFFGCNSAEQQAVCYDDCSKATASQIELFTACAGTSICDPACRTNITPKPAGGGPVTGTGATPSSCSTACEKLVSCSFVKPSEKDKCLGVCQKEAYQYQIDCVNNTACGKIQSACGGGSTGTDGTTGTGSADAVSIARCQSGCDGLLARECVNASGQAACRAKCAATQAAKRDTFSSCLATAVDCSEGNGCLAAL